MLALMVGLEVYLAWAYRDSFAGVVNAHARPIAAHDARLAEARA